MTQRQQVQGADQRQRINMQSQTQSGLRTVVWWWGYWCLFFQCHRHHRLISLTRELASPGSQFTLVSRVRKCPQYYFICGSFTGFVRVKYAQKDYTAISPLWIEAEQLARQYEYNDYLTSLYLNRGHIS